MERWVFIGLTVLLLFGGLLNTSCASKDDSWKWEYEIAVLNGRLDQLQDELDTWEYHVGAPYGTPEGDTASMWWNDTLSGKVHALEQAIADLRDLVEHHFYGG